MYDQDAYAADKAKVSELMDKMDKCFHGYPRMVIVLACTRSIGRKPFLGPLVITESNQVEGRMVGLLPRRGAAQ